MRGPPWPSQPMRGPHMALSWPSQPMRGPLVALSTNDNQGSHWYHTSYGYINVCLHVHCHFISMGRNRRDCPLCPAKRLVRFANHMRAVHNRNPKLVRKVYVAKPIHVQDVFWRKQRFAWHSPAWIVKLLVNGATPKLQRVIAVMRWKKGIISWIWLKMYLNIIKRTCVKELLIW